MKIHKIRVDELSRSCEKLKEYIDQEKPNWIIPICSGGLELCELLWGRDRIPDNIIHGVYIQHNPGIIKDIVKYLPECVTDLMRKVDCVRPKSKKRKVICGDLSELTGKILILDDAIDTGVTIDILKSRLKGKNIKAAVINNIQGSQGIDFSVYNRVLIKFPWNIDYK